MRGRAFALLLLLAVAALRCGGSAAAPPLWELVAAPCAWDDAGGVEARAVAFVDASGRRLHAALYELGLPSVAAALARARGRGVDVAVHLETDNASSAQERKCLRILAAAGVPVTWDGRRSLMHDKFMVADDGVWTGSANLTWTGCHLHYNEALTIRDPAVAARFEDAFQRLRDGADLQLDPDDLAPLPVGDGQVRVAFGPGRVSLMREAIEGARREVSVAAFCLTCPEVVDALIERARAGVRVEVLLDDRQSRSALARHCIASLQHAGARVRIGCRKPHRDLLLRFGLPTMQDVKIHHKLIVVDERRVCTGSANLTRNGVERNDENVVSLEAPEVAQAYGPLLEKVREASREIDPQP